MIEIAQFRAEELPILRRLMNEYLLEFDPESDPASYWDEEYFACLMDGVEQHTHVILLAHTAEEPVGFALLRLEHYWYRKSAVCGIFEEFYVAPQYRRSGVGKALVQRGLPLLRRMGATTIRASVLRVNLTGLLFWQNIGFTIEAYDLYLLQR